MVNDKNMFSVIACSIFLQMLKSLSEMFLYIVFLFGFYDY